MITSQYNSIDTIALDLEQMVKFFQKRGEETNTKEEADKIINSIHCLWYWIRDYTLDMQKQVIKEYTERICGK